VISSGCNEVPDIRGMNCSQFVHEFQYDCVSLTDYDCHCTCASILPTPAPTTIPVQWNKKTGQCLECRFDFTDLLSNVDECLDVCLKDSDCNAVTWYDPPIYIKGWSTNCCPEKKCSLVPNGKEANGTVYYKELALCYLTLENIRTEPGFWVTPYWYNCAKDGILGMVDETGKIVQQQPLNGSGISEMWRVPSDAKHWTTWSIVAFDAKGKTEAFRNFSIVPPTCQFDCGYQVYPRSCQCDTTCGPVGGFYEPCCPDRDQFCSATNTSATIRVITSHVPTGSSRIEVEWWGGAPGGLVQIQGTDFKYPSPGFGKANVTVKVDEGNHTVVLLDANGGAIAKDVVTVRTDEKNLEGTIVAPGLKGAYKLHIYGSDTDLKEEGYHLLTVASPTYLMGDNMMKIPLESTVEFVYHAELSARGFSLTFGDCKSTSSCMKLSGELILEGDYYDDAFKHDWDWSGTFELGYESNIKGNFSFETSR